jgi:hypothetical protein
MSGFGARLRNLLNRLKKPGPPPEPEPAPRPEPEGAPELHLEPEPALEPEGAPEPQPEPGPKPQPEAAPEPSSIREKIRRRISLVAESILDNEQLTSDLDDTAAQELIDWGLSAARQIVQGTADQEDDEAAEEAISPRLSATHRMMRAVDLWVVNLQAGNAEGRNKALASVLEQASIIYGRPFSAMNDEQRARLSKVESEYAGDPPQMIAHLRELFERPDDVPNNQEGGK